MSLAVVIRKGLNQRVFTATDHCVWSVEWFNQLEVQGYSACIISFYYFNFESDCVHPSCVTSEAQVTCWDSSLAVSEPNRRDLSLVYSYSLYSTFRCTHTLFTLRIICIQIFLARVEENC